MVKIIGTLFVCLSYVGCMCAQDVCDVGLANSSDIQSYRFKTTIASACNCSESCIRKCCAPGFYYTKGYCKRYEEESVFSVYVYDQTTLVSEENVSFSYGKMESCETYHQVPSKHLNISFFLQGNGQLYVPYYRKYFRPNSYCVEWSKKKNVFAFLCFPDDAVEKAGKHITGIGNNLF